MEEEEKETPNYREAEREGGVKDQAWIGKQVLQEGTGEENETERRGRIDG